MCQYPLNLMVNMLSPGTLTSVRFEHFEDNQYKYYFIFQVNHPPNVLFSLISQQQTQKLGSRCVSGTSHSCSSNQQVRYCSRATSRIEPYQTNLRPHTQQKIKKYIRASVGQKYETNLSGSCPSKLDFKKLPTRFEIQLKQQKKFLHIKEVKQDNPKFHHEGNHLHNIPFCKDSAAIISRLLSINPVLKEKFRKIGVNVLS